MIKRGIFFICLILSFYTCFGQAKTFLCIDISKILLLHPGFKNFNLKHGYFNSLILKEYNLTQEIDTLNKKLTELLNLREKLFELYDKKRQSLIKSYKEKITNQNIKILKDKLNKLLEKEIASLDTELSKKVSAIGSKIKNIQTTLTASSSQIGLLSFKTNKKIDAMYISIIEKAKKFFEKSKGILLINSSSNIYKTPKSTYPGIIINPLKDIYAKKSFDKLKKLWNLKSRYMDRIKTLIQEPYFLYNGKDITFKVLKEVYATWKE